MNIPRTKVPPLKTVLSRIAAGRTDKRPLPIDQVAEGIAACYRNSKSLLIDAALLAANGSQPRALSFTVLALEELAKVPDLHEQYLNPTTRNDAQAWAEFWGRFIQHKPKQKRIAGYGDTFAPTADRSNEENPDWSPFEHFLDAELVTLLDTVKQRGFYVDHAPPRFVSPAPSEDVAQAFSILYGFAQERIYAFGTWHVTTQRSLDFLATCVSALDSGSAEADRASELLTTFSGWASTFTTEELVADLYRALSYYSASSVPDYLYCLTICKNIFDHLSPSDRVVTLQRIAADLKDSYKCPFSPQAAGRALKMYKLALCCVANALSDSECQLTFGITPEQRQRIRFHDAS